MNRKHKIDNWIGKRAGDWYILDYSHFSNEHYWSVKCSCGLITTRRASQLVSGRTNSCRSCSSKKREASKSPFWRGINEMSGQYLTKLTFRKKDVGVSLEDLYNQWVLQKGKCRYSGVPLTLVSKDSSWSKSTASLDRIDSSKGYIVGNIQWVHKRINTMKNDMRESEFLEWCEQIVNYSGHGGSCGS